jgi:hypothetical protein
MANVGFLRCESAGVRASTTPPAILKPFRHCPMLNTAA